VTRTPIVIVGSGGQGREIHDLVETAADDELEVVGYLDDSPAARYQALVEARGSKILGGLDWLSDAAPEIQVLVGIAAPGVRHRVDSLILRTGRRSPTIVHPTATVGSQCRLGPGTVLWPGARLTTNISLGRHVHVNQAVTIGHDTIVRDYVTLNPAAAVSGDCVVQENVLLGAQSCILQGLTVGAGAVVGAAACVVRDVTPGVTVRGVPAR
jgi:sugar O-acyltransferase (sialic acid O-acetyltransferase NeuD family)